MMTDVDGSGLENSHDCPMPEVLFSINGASVTSPLGNTFPVSSAKHEKQICVAHSAEETIAKRACDAALQAFGDWKQTSATHRRELILRPADLLELRRAQIVASQVDETSCEPKWASRNLSFGLANLREIAASISAVFGELPRVDSEANLAMVLKEPIGPSLLIAPEVLPPMTRASTEAE